MHIDQRYTQEPCITPWELQRNTATARDSGSVRGRRYVQVEHADLVRVLYMATLTPVVCNPTGKAFYESL